MNNIKVLFGLRIVRGKKKEGQIFNICEMLGKILDGHFELQHLAPTGG
jgi:hypothetical protein